MEEITWTFFVLDFDDTFDNEEPDSLGCAPLVFMVPESQTAICAIGEAKEIGKLLIEVEKK